MSHSVDDGAYDANTDRQGFMIDLTTLLHMWQDNPDLGMPLSPPWLTVPTTEQTLRKLATLFEQPIREHQDGLKLVRHVMIDLPHFQVRIEATRMSDVPRSVTGVNPAADQHMADRTAREAVEAQALDERLDMKHELRRDGW